MAITLEETFRVEAPLQAVWDYVLDAQRVAACMPGAALDEVVDDQTFHGTIRIKVGAITTSYKGRVQLTEIDENERSVRMLAEGREASGGTARGTMASQLRAISPTETEVVVEASVDLTGRIAQVSRGMIQGVSQQLFAQFVTCAKATLETPEAAAAAMEEASRPVSILPLVIAAVWSSLMRMLHRLFSRDKRTPAEDA